MSEVVTFELGDDHVGVVTLNRPDKLNAMDDGVFRGLHAAAGEAADAARAGTCRAVLVLGAGRAFSAGLDVSLFGEQLSEGVPSDEHIAWLQQAFTGFEELPVPTVAAVRGPTLGGGCQLAIACHLRVAAPDARIGLAEARWGLVPDLGGTYRLPRLVGLGRATELVLTARRFDAEEALASGFAQLALSHEDPQGEAHAYAARLAAGPGALRRGPRLLRENLARDRSTALAAEAAAQIACMDGHDFGEAVAAHLEERAPTFVGR